MQGQALWTMTGLVALTMGLLFLIPLIHKKAPAALVSIIAVSLLVLFARIDTETVLSFIQAKVGSGIQAGLPSFAFPHVPLSWETLVFVTPYALILAAIGLIESLMTLTLIDELTLTHGHGNRGMCRPGRGQLHQRPLWRHGWVCHDRPEHHQYQLGRTRPSLGNRGRCRPVILYSLHLQLH